MNQEQAKALAAILAGVVLVGVLSKPKEAAAQGMVTPCVPCQQKAANSAG